MHRIGFRRVLAIALTAIEVALVLLSGQRTRTGASFPESTRYRPVAHQEVGGAMIFTPAYHHRTADTYWVGTGMMLWSGLSLAIALSTKKAD
jgi:hypothetical protein